MSRNRPKTRVHTARKRASSSTQWLQRQLNDPYVAEAKRLGYRSRAAFKLLEMDEKLHIIRPGQTIVDLGAAPGGWSQIAAARGCQVIALDLLAVDPIPGMTFLQMDFMADDAPQALLSALNGIRPDLVLSDMSPNTTGHKQTDHIRIMALVEAAYYFARDILAPGGHFLAKVFQGGTQKEILDLMKQEFESIRHIKPPASRKESPEQYVFARNFKGKSDESTDESGL